MEEFTGTNVLLIMEEFTATNVLLIMEEFTGTNVLLLFRAVLDTFVEKFNSDVEQLNSFFYLDF
jgi:hypothetical protein